MLTQYSDRIRVRDWLADKTFEEQFAFGVKELQRYGALIPTSEGWIFIPFQ